MTMNIMEMIIRVQSLDKNIPNTQTVFLFMNDLHNLSEINGVTTMNIMERITRVQSLDENIPKSFQNKVIKIY